MGFKLFKQKTKELMVLFVTHEQGEISLVFKESGATVHCFVNKKHHAKVTGGGYNKHNVSAYEALKKAYPFLQGFEGQSPEALVVKNFSNPVFHYLV